MPRRRWKLRDRREPLSPALRTYLELGLGGLQALAKASRPAGYEAATYFTHSSDRAAAWQEHGEDILAAWVREHAGSRPWGWWQYVATVPRACLEGAEFVLRGKNPGDWAWIWKKNFGIPGCPQVRRPGAKPARMVFEAQSVYLQRFGLLLPGEADQLTAEDREPQIVEIPELAVLDDLSGPRPPCAPALASTNGAARRPTA